MITQRKKAIRLFAPGLYSLDLTNNFIGPAGIVGLCRVLFGVDDRSMQQLAHQLEPRNRPYINKSHQVSEEEKPLISSVRVLTLDYNYLDEASMDSLAKVIINSKQVRILSISNCKIMPDEIDAFCSVGIKYTTSLVYLDMSSNPIGARGLNKLLDNGLKFNQSLLFLDLFDIELT
jgi:hypothetical protein